MGVKRNYSESVRLNERLCHLVPGGAHTYAKGADQYPEGMAPVISHGRGAQVCDVDGNRYVEYGSGLRSVALGHAHPRVNKAAAKAFEAGTNFVRPAAIELEAAEKLLSILPRADMVKFAKNGSDATTAAVRLARAATGRDHVAVCRDHPFFSVDDWFIGISAMPAGIPKTTREQTLTFGYGDLDGTKELFQRYPGQIAGIVLEGATIREPDPGYFPGLRRLCDEFGVLLIIDEMIAGFRWSLGGAQDLFNIDADLSTFGKAMGNGFAVSALAGRREHMRLGGMDHRDERVFLLSTTHGAETHALAAAMEVIDIYQEEGIVEILHRTGDRLAERVRSAIAAADVAEHVLLTGRASNLVHATLGPDGERSQSYRTLFLGELLEHGVIAPSFVVSAALTEADIEATAQAVYQAGRVYRRALDEGIDKHLRGRPVQPALRPYA
jgi:glutamate-1-semialdehyde 2,1-aminomutase